MKLKTLINSEITSFNYELVYLEIGSDLAIKLCQIIEEEFEQAKKLE